MDVVLNPIWSRKTFYMTLPEAEQMREALDGVIGSVRNGPCTEPNLVPISVPVGRVKAT
jgi:hypothetical protein